VAFASISDARKSANAGTKIEKYGDDP